MLPAAPPGGTPPYATATAPTRVFVPPNDHVVLALPPTAASASVLRSLRAEGVSVSAVGDGIGVLDAVRTREPAMLVLDIELPGPDQAGVIAAVQSEAPNVAVIAITPRERRNGLLVQLRGDRDDYLLRPFGSTSSPRGSGCGCGWARSSRAPCSARASWPWTPSSAT